MWDRWVKNVYHLGKKSVKSITKVWIACYWSTAKKTGKTCLLIFPFCSCIIRAVYLCPWSLSSKYVVNATPIHRLILSHTFHTVLSSQMKERQTEIGLGKTFWNVTRHQSLHIRTPVGLRAKRIITFFETLCSFLGWTFWMSLWIGGTSGTELFGLL